ncbi:MAG: integrase arm-type DNA-binding domain-containing protein, partial [Kangiellaceae bacterium]|nr:integrase arm-type DNA-binding domain-containing protein [Kangiellaceae bacterium]
MLTELQIKNVQPKKKNGKAVSNKLSDEKGLYLLITATGAKYWRFDYRFAGKRKTLAIGVYPEISLKEARSVRRESRELIRQDIDPGLQKQLKKRQVIKETENSFELVAREWQKIHLNGKSNSHVTRSSALINNDLIPELGRRPINQIEAPELLYVLRKIERRSVDMAHRARTLSGQIFRYSIQTGRSSRDPSADLRGALKPKNKKHYAAIIEPSELARLLVAIDDYQGTLSVKNALKLAPMLMLRPGNLRAMKWSNVNWERELLEYSAEEMKTKDRPHLVPLSHQAIEILRLQQMYSGRREYVFPCQGKPQRPLSDNGLRTALMTIGFSSEVHTVHGFRSTARTIMEEVLDIPQHLLEHQLHHLVRDRNGRAYNRTTHL